jgi:hypothetical protein
MTEDIEIFQDLCDTLGIHGTLKLPVDIRTFAAGAGGLRDLGKDPASDPRHIQQCVEKVYQGLGPTYFSQLIDTPEDVDDMWVMCWCPQPPGSKLHAADCPAGTTPLWTNGTATVFARKGQDSNGFLVFDFGNC